jgi:hypothetical protein
MSNKPESNDAQVDGQSSEPGETGAPELLTVGATALAPEEQITREQRRSRRKRAVRARTISVKRMTKRELEIGRLLYPDDAYWKPKHRNECVDGPRPCPFVSCKHHLFVDVSPRTGAIKLNFPDLEVWDMGESCALDVADRGGTTMMALREYVDEGPVGKRRLPRLSKADLATIDTDESEDDLLDDSDIEDDDDVVTDAAEKGPKKAELDALEA